MCGQYSQKQFYWMNVFNPIYNELSTQRFRPNLFKSCKILQYLNELFTKLIRDYNCSLQILNMFI